MGFSLQCGYLWSGSVLRVGTTGEAGRGAFPQVGVRPVPDYVVRPRLKGKQLEMDIEQDDFIRF